MNKEAYDGFEDIARCFDMEQRDIEMHLFADYMNKFENKPFTVDTGCFDSGLVGVEMAIGPPG